MGNTLIVLGETIPNVLKPNSGCTIGIAPRHMDSNHGMKLCKLGHEYYGCLVMSSDLPKPLYASFYRNAGTAILCSSGIIKADNVHFYYDNQFNLYVRAETGSLIMPIVLNMDGDIYMEFISYNDWPSGLTQIV